MYVFQILLFYIIIYLDIIIKNQVFGVSIMNNVHYETRYVAFLDLLGFKDMVDQSTKSQSILNKINKVLNYTYEVQHNNYDGFMSLVEFGKQVTTFSDSIVISYSTSTPGGGFHILMDLIYICIDLFDNGILVRGGVTVGQLIHNEQKCFGPAMNEAYRMESTDAIYPQILINKNVLDFDLQNPGPANTVEQENEYLSGLIKTVPDDENLFILDYLKQKNEFEDSYAYIEFIFNTREFIVENLSKFKDSKRVYEKYEWLKCYYNETINTVCSELEVEKLLI